MTCGYVIDNKTNKECGKPAKKYRYMGGITFLCRYHYGRIKEEVGDRIYEMKPSNQEEAGG